MTLTKPRVWTFFDESTYTATHVVAEPEGPHAAIIDSVLDYDAASARTSTRSADQVVAHVEEHSLTIDWILETHVHADHLTAAPYLKGKLGGKVGVGADVTIVQETFKGVFNAECSFRTDGSQFDHLFEDNEAFTIGALEVQVMHTPGHTPACITYLTGDAAFVGDTMFMPDYGSARCDFPGGDARTLYRSLRRVLELPPETRLFLCHDYKAPPERTEFAWETTVAEVRAKHIHLHDGIGEDEFVGLRTERDKQLSMPALILPSVQVNMRAGAFPPPDQNGIAYLKLPLNAM